MNPALTRVKVIHRLSKIMEIVCLWLSWISDRRNHMSNKKKRKKRANKKKNKIIMTSNFNNFQDKLSLNRWLM